MDEARIPIETLSVTGTGGSDCLRSQNPVPVFVEQGFRWMRECIELIYTNHQHPLPMTALIFMYAETLGKPLCLESNLPFSTENKVCIFVEQYLPDLWKALESNPTRRSILADYRNGLIHQMFMKGGCAIHEDKAGTTQYVVENSGASPVSINIDRLQPEFKQGIASYENRIEAEVLFRAIFINAMLAP
jgi:hypothetical protein